MAIGTAAAIIGGAVIGAGASMIGSRSAADATKDAAKRATNAELEMYNQSRTDLMPYREAGYNALDSINQLYGLPAAPRASSGITPTATGSTFDQFGNLVAEATPGPAAGTAPAARDLSGFYASPQYEFVRSEGLRGQENSAAARGGAYSGNAIRGAEMFATNLASGEFQSYVDRLFSIAGLGGGATSQGVTSSQNTGNTLANIYTGAGNARATSYLAGAGGVNNALQGGLQNYMFNQYLQGGGSQGSGGYGIGGIGGGALPPSPGPWAGGYVFPK